MVKQITPQDALTLIEQDKAIIIDVREPDEFLDSHIPYASSIPMSIIDNMFHHMKFPSDKVIIFQCKSGGRSGRVCEYILTIPEIKNEILNLDGGITAWVDDGFIVI